MTSLGDVEQIVIRRAGQQPVEIEPSSLDISLASFGLPETCQGEFDLSGPAGWRIIQHGECCWRAEAVEIDPDTLQTFELQQREAGELRRCWRRSIPLVLDLRTTFAPEIHAFPERNSIAALGDIRPDEDEFNWTYAGMPGWAMRILRRGLYRDVVFFVSEGQYRGGLCSGMARWAGLRALNQRGGDVGRDLALKQIIVLHGRQLTDRALLSSAKWFFRASPRAAYFAVRNDALKHGLSLRALDVNISKPWRRDVATAIVRQGHTVVPVRVRQNSPTEAEVDVYDPNRGMELQTIRFDLQRDRYAFRSMVSMEQRDIGMAAVPHMDYARRGSAWLAVAGSILWLAIKRVTGRRKHRSR